ncbi:MAG: DEAD/DEAH box helicase, partial [Wenzhouxiangella sp.]
MGLSDFSPLVRDWFETRFAQPTLVQSSAWPLISAGHNVLVCAPTGEGKSLAAWLPLVDRLCCQKADKGVRVLYISPLRALSRDMAAGILDFLEGLGSKTANAAGARAAPSIGLRTGDTSAGERDKQRRNPPEILLTTPESLFVLLGSTGGRAMLATVETVIIDEIHALIGNKRGAHLSMSLERLEVLCGRPLQRIGLSAT